MINQYLVDQQVQSKKDKVNHINLIGWLEDKKRKDSVSLLNKLHSYKFMLKTEKQELCCV